MKLVIFDLDGTLLDTIEDITDSLNHAIQQFGFPMYSIDKVKTFVGNGVRILIERALSPFDVSSQILFAVQKEYMEVYEAWHSRKTKPYDGIMELLEQLVHQQVKLAILSNKPHDATVSVVNHFFPTIPFQVVLGQKPNAPVKPDPSLIYSIQTECREYSNTWMVGDSIVDIQTAKNATISSIAVTWGFQSKEDLLLQYPDYIVDCPSDIIHIRNKNHHL